MSTILFVEDQFELRAVHTAYLQSHGFNVITAESGEAGLELGGDMYINSVLPAQAAARLRDALK